LQRLVFGAAKGGDHLGSATVTGFLSSPVAVR
jgi:hypothetical protein